MANTVLTLHRTSRNTAHLLYTGTTAAGSTALTDIAALEQSDTGGVQKLVCGFGGSRSTESTNHETFTIPVELDDKVAFLMSCYSSATTSGGNIVIKGGSTSARGAWRSTGDITIALGDFAGAEVRRYLAGPYESAKIAIAAEATAVGVKKGEYYMQITHETTVALNCGRLEVLAFSMPSVKYAT